MSKNFSMSSPNKHYVTAESAGTLSGLFVERINRSPHAVAYRYYDTQSEHWQNTTWAKMAELVSRWQKSLSQEDLQAGDRVAIMLNNCREWVIFEQAALGLGLVIVPLYTNDRAENIAYIIQDAQVKVLLVQGDEHWECLKNVNTSLHSLQRILSLEEITHCDNSRVTCIHDWLHDQSDPLQKPNINAQALATIVYTSGTTGPPKGVMLSHANILSNAYAASFCYPFSPQDLFLSFLPLSHMFERTVGYYLPMLCGATVAYARSITELSEDLVTLRPTLLVTVPRIFERIYNKIQLGLEQKSPLARKLFETTVEVGWQRFQYGQGKVPWQWKQLLWPLLNTLVASKIMTKLGGRMRLAISGGAPLSFTIARTFIGLGLTISQGYGMTEASPSVCTNYPKDNDPASVGEPLDKIEVRLGDNDELLVRGPCVMLGYWHNKQATEQAIDADGWLHTGDKARIDNNHIYITGRIKEILVLSNGEKVPPADLELAITTDPLFEQIMVLGEAKPYLSAIAVLEKDNWQRLAAEFNLDPQDPNNFKDPRVIEAALKRISQKLHHFPGYAEIYRILLTQEPWTVESGLITPTLKLKREHIHEKYANELAALYEGH